MSRRSKGWGCCGPTWSFSSTVTITDEDDEEPPASSPQQAETLNQLMQYDDNHNSSSRPSLTTPHRHTCHHIISDQHSESLTSMNLAAALAAERQYRENNMIRESTSRNMGTPERVSLMKLLEENRSGEKGEEEAGIDRVCCVCMGRRKGAAFIPCGHTFCRVCSREVWLNRGSCPLCNRSILEILDIF